MKRVITELEEKVIRLVHHDFKGLTQAEAAQHLNVSQALISRAILQVKKKASQLFPILTRQQKFIYNCIAREGFSHQGIARLLDVSKDTIDSTIATMKAKGVYFERPYKTIRYETYHDEQVKQKF